MIAETPSMRRAIIVGASSGIGWELARVLIREGWMVGVAARREICYSSWLPSARNGYTLYSSMLSKRMPRNDCLASSKRWVG